MPNATVHEKLPIAEAVKWELGQMLAVGRCGGWRPCDVEHAMSGIQPTDMRADEYYDLQMFAARVRAALTLVP